MRIIFISTYLPEYSGPALRMMELNKFFKEDVLIFCPLRTSRGIRLDIYKAIGFKEYIVSFRTIYILDFIIGILFSILLPYKKVVHVLGSSPLSHALFLVTYIRRDIRLLFELVCNDSSPIIKFRRLPIKFYPNKKSTLILPLNKNQNVYGFKYLLKPNPISDKVTDYLNINSLKRIDKKDFVYLGYLSKFMFKKNQLFLIDVLSFLPETYKLILAGPYENDNYFKKESSNKDYLDLIKNKIIDNNLRNRITLNIGFINPIEFYKKIDIYLNPSMQEGFGTTFIEALALGLPVIGNKDIYTFKECKELCPETVKLASIIEPKDFAKAIINLNYEVSEEKLRKSSKKVLKNYSKSRIIEIYKEAIQMLEKT